MSQGFQVILSLSFLSVSYLQQESQALASRGKRARDTSSTLPKLSKQMHIPLSKHIQWSPYVTIHAHLLVLQWHWAGPL